MCGTACAMSEMSIGPKAVKKGVSPDKISKAKAEQASKKEYDRLLFADYDFRYINRPAMRNKHTGCIIIASKKTKGRNSIAYGVAYCSPKDAYDKSLGKRMAVERCERGNNTVVPAHKTCHDINKAIIFHILSDATSYPTWAGKFLNGVVEIQLLMQVRDNIPKMTFVDLMSHALHHANTSAKMRHPLFSLLGM